MAEPGHTRATDESDTVRPATSTSAIPPAENTEKDSGNSWGPSPLQVAEEGQSGGDNDRAAPPPPPNGGYGWVCTACVSCVNGHTWGLNSSYGVFLAYYLAHDTFPGGTHLQYAFVGSLSLAGALGISPLATIGVREIGTKATMFIGCVFEAASLIAASFATEMWHLFLSQGVLFGIGMGLMFVPSVSVVPQWFTTRRSLANGISACGSGLGGLIYSFAAGALIQQHGLAWAFRVLGIIAFVANTICIILIKDRNKAIGTTHLAFDTTLFKRPEYLLVLAYGWFSILGYVVLIFSLANYANEIGLDTSQASLISAFFNLGQGVGRPFVGYFSDQTGRINMAALMTFLGGVFSLAIWINAKTYGVLIFFAILDGMVAGTFWATIAPVAAEVVGLKDVASALNLLWLSIILPSTFSEPIALQIFTGTGSYLGTQLWTGFMYMAAAGCMFVLRGWKLGETKEISHALHELPEHIDRVKIENDEQVMYDARRVGRKRMVVDCYKPGKV